MFARRPKEATMMLENKTAAIYGGGGAIGGAVARGFADAGARVSLAGRSMPRLEKGGERHRRRR
jgi:NAD(P)-dependent dehydrogenase (short-subunit alcohol dehydrogenase family)